MIFYLKIQPLPVSIQCMVGPYMVFRCFGSLFPALFRGLVVMSSFRKCTSCMDSQGSKFTKKTNGSLECIIFGR